MIKKPYQDAEPCCHGVLNWLVCGSFFWFFKSHIGKTHVYQRVSSAI